MLSYKFDHYAFFLEKQVSILLDGYSYSTDFSHLTVAYCFQRTEGKSISADFCDTIVFDFEKKSNE